MQVLGVTQIGFKNLTEAMSTWVSGNLFFFSSEITEQQIDTVLDGSVDLASFISTNEIASAGVSASSSTLSASRAELELRVVDSWNKPIVGSILVTDIVGVNPSTQSQSKLDQYKIYKPTEIQLFLLPTANRTYNYPEPSLVSLSTITYSSDTLTYSAGQLLRNSLSNPLSELAYTEALRTQISDYSPYMSTYAYKLIYSTPVLADTFIFSVKAPSSATGTLYTDTYVKVIGKVADEWLELGVFSLTSSAVHYIEFPEVLLSEIRVVQYGTGISGLGNGQTRSYYMQTAALAHSDSSDVSISPIVVDKAIFVPFYYNASKLEDAYLPKVKTVPMISMSVGIDKDINTDRDSYLLGDILTVLPSKIYASTEV